MIRALLVMFSVLLFESECLSNRDTSLCDTKYSGSAYLIPHPQYCDKYVACQKGSALVYVCEDGLGYHPVKGCRPLHTVDCSSRPLLQPPKGSGPCTRRYGIFADPRGCGRFFKCVNDSAIPDKCSPGLTFDEKRIGCRESTKEESEQCQELALLGCNVDPNGDLSSCTWFRCPADDTFPYGDHSRHPYPGNCGFYILCIRGGQVKIQGCPEGTIYSSESSMCESELNSTSCKSPRNLIPLIHELPPPLIPKFDKGKNKLSLDTV